METADPEHPAAPVLRGRRVLLRPAVAGDVEGRLAIENDPDILRMFGVSRDQVEPVNRPAAERWVARLREQDDAWVIMTERLIGEIRLHGLHRADRRAFLAIGILDPTCLGQGLGTEAIQMVLRYAFGPMGLHRVTVRVLAYNVRAIRAYEKCGFVVEGREREAAWVDGAWHDDIIMGLLETDFGDERPAGGPHP